jgi:outer membrane lipoprotein-sorting protein
VLFEDHSGSVTRVTLTGVKTNVGIGNKLFRFTPPAGAAIVQP